MPIYSVQAPDGNIYDVSGPEGASQADLFAATEHLVQQARANQLQAKLAELRSAPIRPAEVSGFGAAKAAAWQNLQADLAAVAGKTGIMSEADAEKTIAEKKKEAARVFTPTENWSDAPWTKFKELVGGTLPYTVAPLAAGAAAAALPVVGVGGATAGLIGTGLAGLASATQFTGSNLSAQMEGDGGDKKSLAQTELAPAIAGALPQAALDIVSFKMMPIIGRAFKSIGKELTEEQLKQVAQRGLLNNMGRSGLKTGSVESLTETGQQLIERLQAGFSITDEKARAEYLESAIGGGVLGFPLGALGGIGARGRARNKLSEIEAGRKPPEQVAPPQLTGQGELFPELAGIQGPVAPQGVEPPELASTSPESLPLDFGEKRQAELEQTFNSQEPDLLGDIVPARNAEPELTPLEVRAKELTQEFIDKGVPPKAAAFAAYQQARDEQRDDTLASMQNGEMSDPRQNELQFAPRGQLSLFNDEQAPTPTREEGLQRGVGEQPEAEAPAQPQAIITAQALDVLGIPKSAPAYKLSLGKDLSDPVQRLGVSNALRSLAANPNTKPKVRTNIQNVLQQSPFVQVQGELFGPNGGVLRTREPTLARMITKEAKKAEEAKNANTPKSTGTTAESAAESGASESPVDVGGASVEPTPASTESTTGVSESKEQGLAGTGRRAKPDNDGKGKAQSSVAEEEISQEEQDALQAELDAELTGAPVEAEAKAEGIDWDFFNKESARIKRKVANAERVERRAEMGPESKAAKEKLAKALEEGRNFYAKWNPIINAAADKTIAKSEAKAAKAESETDSEAKDKALNEKVREWDKANRTMRNESWQDGALQANPAFEAVKAQGSSVPAHGMSKVSTLGQGVKDLIAMVNGGIRPGLYFEALTRPDKAAGAASASGTAGGVAYRDGPFIITFREGVTSPTSADITGVLVNPSIAEIIPALRAVLPNVRIESYQDVQTLLGEPNTKAEPKAKPAPKAKKETKAEPKAEPETKAEEVAPEVNPEWEELAAKETNEYQKWFATNVQKYKIDKDDIGKSRDPDRRKVGSLLRGPAKAKKTTTSDLFARNSAHVYFSKMPRLVDNLRNIAFDIAANTPRFKEGLQNVPAPEAKFFKGMSKTAAAHAQRWVQANLSTEANAKLDEMVIAYKEEQIKFADKNFTDKLLGHDKTSAEYEQKHEDEVLLPAARALLNVKKRTKKPTPLHKTEPEVKNIAWKEANAEDIIDNIVDDILGGRGYRELPQDAVSRLGVPLHPAVRAMLEAGNLQGALNALAGQTNGIVGRIVRLLASVVGGTRVEVVNNLVGEDGKPAAGLFDPATNTIRLDSKTGLNNHTLIHEMTHGALSHILDNANHPVTRQLTKIFNSVKPMLDTAYGAQSLQEFVAEAWGNVEFREKLSALHPDGTPISAWQRFTNTVKNFMRSMIGMQHKSIESAYDQTDRLMESIISPAPGMRTAGSLYLAASNPSVANAFFNSMGQAYSNIPYFNTDTKDAFRNVFTARIPDAIRRFLLSALPANALSDVAESIIPMAKQFDKLVHLKSGREGRLYSEVEPTINRVRDWAKKQSADTMRNFNDVVYESTVNRVDPSKLRSAYVDKYGNSLTDTSGNKLADAWDALEPKWRELQRNGGAQVYGEMRDTYKKLYDKIGDILRTRIDDEFGKSKEATKAYGMLKKLFDERGIIEPYFPLTRRGDYWLSYNMAVNNPDGTPKSNEQYIEAFETKIARDRAIADLQAMADADKNLKFSDVNEFRKGEKINYSNAPSSSFMGRVLDVLDANNVGAESREAIMELYLNALPENSFAQSFRNRKDTLGFDKDAVRAFSNKTYGITRQLANVEYGAKFQQLGSDISKYVRNLVGNKEQAQMYEREFAKRIKFVLHPEVSEWSKLSTSIGFNALLGFNLSSAIVNLTQLPLVTLPYLGGKYGYSETMKAMGEATRLFTASGFKDKARVDILGVKSDIVAGPSMANYDWSDPSKLPPEIRKYAALVEKALDYGQLNRSQIFDILAVDKTDSVGNKVNAMSGFMFHHGERMNREVTLATAYDLELQRMKSNPTKEEAVMTTAQKQDRAAENAINITELTNGSASASAAPSLAQGNIGRILFMFKRYGVSMYYMLFKTAMETVKGQDAATRGAALRQVAGIYGSSALLAGLKGVPMFGIAAMIYNMFKEDDDDDFETQVRKWTNETVYSGALNGLTNLEFASRIGLSDLIFRDQKAPETQTALLTLLETLGGPVYGVGKKFERGITLMNEGHIERGVEQMLPSAIGNMLKGVRFGTEGATTLRGDPITGDISAWNAGAQMLGFAPADYIAQQEINANAKGFERTVIKQQKSLLLNYYMAARQGDTEAVQDITQKMGEFNKKHPTIAISGDTLRRSMEGHAKASAQKYHGLTFNKKLLPEIMAGIREYDAE